MSLEETSKSDMQGLWRKSWHYLQRYPILWWPPLLLSVLSDLTLSPSEGAGLLAQITFPFIILMTSVFMLSVAFEAGWLNQIKILLAVSQDDEKRQPISFNHFLVGTGRFFRPLLLGKLALIGLALLSVATLAFIGYQLFGLPTASEVMSIQQMLKDYKPGMAFNISPELQLQLAQWTFLSMIWLSAAALVGSILIIWPQCCVILESSPWQAFAQSWQIFKSNLGTFVLLVTVHGIVIFFVGIQALGASHPVAQFIVFTASLFAEIYFTILYALFVWRAMPPKPDTFTPSQPE